MSDSPNKKLDRLLADIRQCTLCSGKIPAPNPVVRGSSSAKILIIGQAPGTKVHASGIPWDDASGATLRTWMGLNKTSFYDESLVAIVPMGFCYPGKGKSGDLPPRPECAPAWHEPLLALLPSIECTLLIGAYAQSHYSQAVHSSLTERVSSWASFAPETFMLPHPSPRNRAWFKKHPWFNRNVVPALQKHVSLVLSETATSPDFL